MNEIEAFRSCIIVKWALHNSYMKYISVYPRAKEFNYCGKCITLYL